MVRRLHRRMVLAAALAAPAVARAQSSGPLRLIVPFAPGGVTDSTARLLSEAMGAAMGRTVVVDNRSGGAGSIGTGAAAQARPDGNTALLTTIIHVVNPLILRLPFDTVRAFTPVSQTTRVPVVLAVKNDFPARSLTEFVERAKAAPGRVNFGHSGNATASHLVLALLRLNAAIEVNETGYRGGGDTVRDLASGALDAAIISVPSAVPLAQSGRARILAVSSAARSPLLPEVPSFAETLPRVVLDEWTGLFFPAGVTPAQVEALHAAATTALRDPGLRQRLAQIGQEPVGTAPAEFARFLEEQAAEMAELVRAARIEAS